LGDSGWCFGVLGQNSISFGHGSTLQRPFSFFMSTATKFWNTQFASGDEYARVELRSPCAAERAALAHFGNVRGKRVLDLGCGNGAASLTFAAEGADVVALDSSSTAIANLSEFCQRLGISNIHPVVGNGCDLSGIGPVDYIYGAMILHHLEPFAAAAESLGKALAPGGRAFFWENNCSLRLLAWCRNHLVGRGWIPKYGDPSEFPLTSDEVEILRRHFAVRQDFPEMVLLKLVSIYLFRERLSGACVAVDRLLGRTPLRKYSYFQFLFLQR
jgi:2-polyprenyl-3-methyl-5-hydroxy-6-metoxy-1,4-benzoquinol methylase